ncbi:MAG: carbohydrate binding family 9 domain-containing protein [Candidatus Aminicenantes bacterium]|nr:MAG: carbohydrate binding family 9 domain-containing protein [Candidatus Aminicenantes bacterium]
MAIVPVCSLEANEAMEIPFINTPPRIDGKLDDPAWTTAARFRGFKSFKPDYGKPASEETVMYFCSDGENFYFAARCFQKNPAEVKGAMTRRDNMFGDDWVAICIDTFFDMQSAYAFLVNPLGIQGDGMLDIGGDLDASLDMVWYSKGAIDDKGYTVEIKIPFKSIRFPVKKKVKMGLWLVRNIVRTSESLSYPELFPDKGAILTQAQPILVREMKYNRIMEVLPAFTHTRGRSLEAGQWAMEERQTDFSLTGKLGLTPSLVLDGTYNPDFSQVEADAGQVDVNLRYALFYPEKRPFFLEGIDEFQFAGNTEDAPLYAIVHTRNIIDPVFGLKLTGKMGQKTSIASILAIDEPLNGENPPGSGRATFGILRFRHALKKDTYIGGFYTGREVSEGYNRVAGIDGRLRISRFSVAEYHLLGSLSQNPETGDTNAGHALGLSYSYGTRNVILEMGLQDISRDFQVDTGFLTRRGLTRLAAFGMYRFYPKSKFFQRIEPFYWSYHILDKESNLFETCNLFTFRINMPRASMFRIDLILANEVFAGKRFDTSAIGFRAESQITKHLFFYILLQRRGNIYYDPDNPYPGRSNRASLTLQYQPAEKFTTSLDLTYADFYRRSDSQREYDYTILRSRTTFQVSKYLFFRGIAEYNFYKEKLLLDLLASFTYIPGTVVHMGYGSVLEKIRWNMDMEEYMSSRRFQETRRAFFFKVSYLWRL